MNNTESDNGGSLKHMVRRAVEQHKSMMNQKQRAKALEQMQAVSNGFYGQAVQIGVHPFIEFCGLMNEYIKACRNAHERGVDFSECNKHSGQDLPLESFEIEYINEKLECIFTGRSVMSASTPNEKLTDPAT